MKKKKGFVIFYKQDVFGLIAVAIIRYHQQCVSYSHLLPPTYLEPP